MHIIEESDCKLLLPRNIGFLYVYVHLVRHYRSENRTGEIKETDGRILRILFLDAGEKPKPLEQGITLDESLPHALRIIHYADSVVLYQPFADYAGTLHYRLSEIPLGNGADYQLAVRREHNVLHNGSGHAYQSAIPDELIILLIDGETHLSFQTDYAESSHQLGRNIFLARIVRLHFRPFAVQIVIQHDNVADADSMFRKLEIAELHPFYRIIFLVHLITPFSRRPKKLPPHPIATVGVTATVFKGGFKLYAAKYIITFRKIKLAGPK